MQTDPVLVLKPGREKSLLRRHPWIFSGAVDHLVGTAEPGRTVELQSAKGEFLARAAYSPASQIRARVWTFNPSEPVDADFFRNNIQRAIQTRKYGGLTTDPALDEADQTLSDAYRLIHAESDNLPGLIVDRYADTLVVQFLSAGAEFWRETIAAILIEQTGLEKIYERSDADVRELDGLLSRIGPLRGSFSTTMVTITENNLKYEVNLEGGHKTGFYLDQRMNRLKVRGLAGRREVLDCFCYTGGFTLNALAGGARSVLSVDASDDALALCRENIEINNLPSENHFAMEGDVFQLLRKFRDEGRSFDMIILDPPKFAPTAAQAEKAARGYKDINLLGFKLLRPGGLLVTFSCSGGVDANLFQKIIASAVLDAGVEAQILEHLFQAPDHPVALNFPEGTYLKGLICIKK